MSDATLNEETRANRLHLELERRELFYTQHNPSKRSPYGPDDRVLALELARPLLPEPKGAQPKEGALEYLVRAGRDGIQLPDFATQPELAFECLRRIIGPDQPLGKILARPDLSVLSKQLSDLVNVETVEVNAALDEALLEEQQRKREQQHKTVLRLLQALSDPKVACRQASPTLPHLSPSHP